LGVIGGGEIFIDLSRDFSGGWKTETAFLEKGEGAKRNALELGKRKRTPSRSSL